MRTGGVSPYRARHPGHMTTGSRPSSRRTSSHAIDVQTGRPRSGVRCVRPRLSLRYSGASRPDRESDLTSALSSCRRPQIQLIEAVCRRSLTMRSPALIVGSKYSAGDWAHSQPTAHLRALIVLSVADSVRLSGIGPDFPATGRRSVFVHQSVGAATAELRHSYVPHTAEHASDPPPWQARTSSTSANVRRCSGAARAPQAAHA